MALIGGRLASAILSRYQWHPIEAADGYSGAGKLETIFGPQFWDQVRGKTVIDFGAGHGLEAIEIARRGAAKVIGLEIQDRWIAIAREHLRRSGLSNCEFTKHTDQRADVVLSVDSFEHFSDPPGVLAEMARLLKPDGRVIASFGPPWYHPLGGHMPLFPWAHLILTETSVMKWRAKYNTDGATRFHECEGGLNQMGIAKFERTVARSPLQIESLTAVPIRAASRLHCRLTREFLSSIVKTTLVLSAR